MKKDLTDIVHPKMDNAITPEQMKVKKGSPLGGASLGGMKGKKIMSNSNITTQNSKGKDSKHSCNPIDKIRDALNEVLPQIEDTAPNIDPKAGSDEFEGPCPFCKDGEHRLVVFPGENNRYLCRKCPKDKDGKVHSGDKIAFHQKYRGFKSFMALAKNVVPHLFSPAGDTALKEKPGRKEKNKIPIDFTDEWESLPIGDIQKAKIHEFLVGKRGIDPKVVDKHIANGNLKHKDIKGYFHVLAAYKGEGSLPAVQRLTMKGKCFIKGSKANFECFFIAGSEAKKNRYHHDP